MYSPKISEELIPILYQKAKESKKPMTVYTNELIRAQLCEKIKTDTELQLTISKTKPTAA